MIDLRPIHEFCAGCGIPDNINARIDALLTDGETVQGAGMTNYMGIEPL